MQYNFLNIFLDKKELLNQESKSINTFLLENNASQIEQLYQFYHSDVNLLCVNGFLGTGKAQIIDYSTNFLSSETLVLKYNCFESTILDDILLSFFSEFKKLFLQKVILEPKIKTENFSQKINSYFSQIEKPFVIILDSFEAILKENRQEILDFIFHLASFSKIKTILISRTFESSYFENSNVRYHRLSTYALEKSLFEKYIKSEKIKFITPTLDEFYKCTRGYYFYTALSVKIMHFRELSLIDFIGNFKASFLSFDDFLEKQSLDLIPATSRNLFWFLSMIRHPVSVDLLNILHLYDESKINFLIEKLILTQENSLIYVQDYFREQVDVSVAPNISQKIHKYIVDLYQTQLPLKPLERNVLISRQTMRKEIEYHNLFLPKRPKIMENIGFDINYLAYLKGLEFDLELTKSKEPEGQEVEQKQELPTENQAPVDIKVLKNVEINIKDLPFKLSKEEMGLLDNIEEPQLQTPPLEISEGQLSTTAEDEKLSLNEIVENAKRAESNYHYVKAIELYKRALNFEEELDYPKLLPIIYTRMAGAYQKVADYENAIKYFNLAQNFYEDSKEFVKANYIKLSISKILYDSYKIDKAKEYLSDIIKYSENPPILITKVYIQLANIEDNLANINGAFEYYKLAVVNSNEAMDVETMSELYFKYALILDDKNDTKNAIEFYEKCINLSDDYKINKFLSSAYSNIATLYLEKNDIESAVKNYTKAYEIDKENNNYDGMYYSSSKLASILQRKQPNDALKYLEIAMDCAKSLNDIFYMASAYLALGDFYYDKKQDEMALAQYVSAYELVKNDFSKDNINKIQMRINDIKFRLGVERFEGLMQIMRREN